MCKASRRVKNHKPAQVGLAYGLGIVGVHDMPQSQVGALFAIGSSVADCVFCVKEGQQLTLQHIPHWLQQKHGIGETAVVTFRESKDYHKDDVLEFDADKRVQFREFAHDGVRVVVGPIVSVGTKEQVRDIIEKAQAGATVSSSERPSVDA